MKQLGLPPIDAKKIKYIFKSIDRLVTQLLRNVTTVLNQSGLKYFNKPSHDSLMRLLTPYELKVFVDYTDICCLFENRSHIIKNALLKEKNSKKPGFQHEFSSWFPPEPDHNLHLDQSNQQNDEKIEGKHQSSLKQEENLEDRNHKQKFLNQIMFNQKPNLSKKAQEKQNIAILRLQRWLQQQISMGKPVTRNDLKRKARQMGDNLGMRLGQRWFKDYMKNNCKIRNLLTHGNSTEARKAEANMPYESQMLQSSVNNEYQVPEESQMNISEEDAASDQSPEAKSNMSDQSKYGL